MPLERKDASDPNSYTFNYQRDTYTISSTNPLTFGRLPYPSSSHPPLETFLKPTGLPTTRLAALYNLYGENEFNIPIPSFSELFAEQATAPFFVFQVFCVALWLLDEYWYYSLFTLFMLVVFECTVVWQVCRSSLFQCFIHSNVCQRVRTLTEFRTMSVVPYPIRCYRDSKWVEIQTDKLLPGDVVSIGECVIGRRGGLNTHGTFQHVPRMRRLFLLMYFSSMAPSSSMRLCFPESPPLS